MQFWGLSASMKSIGSLCWGVRKTAEPIGLPFAGVTRASPRYHLLQKVNVRRIHLPPRGVTDSDSAFRRNFFDQLLNCVTHIVHAG